MILIVDTNIIIAALIKEGKTRELLIDSPFLLYAPEMVIGEIQKHRELIIEKSGLAENDLKSLLGLLLESINVVEKESFLHKMQEASELIGEADKGDVPFLALALSTPNDGIWTANVQHFRAQNKIRVWTTAELLEMLPHG